MSYGIKLKDASGNTCVLTPEVGTIISAGRVTMPSALVDTDKYYTTIALTTTMNFTDVVVLCLPVKFNINVTSQEVNPGVLNLWQDTFLLDHTKTYYTKNEATGVLTAYAAGNMTGESPTTWDGTVAAYPIAYWEQLGATSGTEIKIFAATCFCSATTAAASAPRDDYPEDNFKYGIYTQGVETVDYAVIVKNSS